MVSSTRSTRSRISFFDGRSDRLRTCSGKATLSKTVMWGQIA
jgi:hypothetical protein